MSGSEDEDDYLSMVIPETTSRQPETSIQRRRRLQREGEERARVKSKSEVVADTEARRNEGLSTSLSSTSKGSKMLEKLGYKPGDRLGAVGNPYALAEPIGMETKDDRGGIGMDSEKKRKVREAAERQEHQAKRAKADEGDFRERVARERKEQREEGQWWGAMRVAEKFDTEAADGNGENETEVTDSASKVDDSSEAIEEAAATSTQREGSNGEAPTQHHTAKLPNLLWRPLPRERAEKERERRIRHDLEQSLSRNPAYTDPDEDKHERLALGKEEVEVDLEIDDPDVDAYLAEPVAERLEKVVRYLREKHWYCFWCKYRYAEKEMEGCPGETEEDHD